MRNELFCVDIRDCSGSMFNMAEDVRGSTASFVTEQQKEEGLMTFTVVDFDSEGSVLSPQIRLNRRVTRQAIKDVNPEIPFVPEGGTPLYDAVAQIIDETGEYLASLPESDRPNKVLIRIFTDGRNNTSVEYDARSLSEKIKHQEEKYNWQFQFLGTNIDAEAEGAKFGLRANQTANYVDYNVMMDVNTSKVKQMRSTSSASAFAASCDYTAEEKSELMESSND